MLKKVSVLLFATTTVVLSSCGDANESQQESASEVSQYPGTGTLGGAISTAITTPRRCWTSWRYVRHGRRYIYTPIRTCGGGGGGPVRAQ